MTLHRWRYVESRDEHRCEKCGYVLRPGHKEPAVCPVTDDYERKAENEPTTESN
jgi:rubrerythrin